MQSAHMLELASSPSLDVSSCILTRIILMGVVHVQDILEDLFLEHEVDMVMSGHVHLYARTCSVKHDRCKKASRGGITHVTVGAL